MQRYDERLTPPRGIKSGPVRYQVSAAILLAAVVVARMVEGSAALGNPPSAADLQRECVSYRETTTREGHIEFQTTTYDRDDGSLSPTVVNFRIWTSGNRLRLDRNQQEPDGKSGGWATYIVSPPNYFWIPEGEFEGVEAPEAEFRNQKGGAIGHFSLFHPRWIGMGINDESLMEIEPLARFVNPGLHGVQYAVAADRIDGVDTWRASREVEFPSDQPGLPANKGEIVMWFAPSEGGSLVKQESREYSPSATRVMSMSASMKQYPPKGFWFPAEVVRTTSANGQPSKQRILKVTAAEFGIPPDPAIFTINGVGLQKGKTISDRSHGKHATTMVSDGKTVVRVKGPFADISEGPPQTSLRFWLLIGNAALFAVLGGVAVHRLRLRKGAG